IPHEFFWEDCISLNILLKEPGYYGVGMAFLPKGGSENALCRDIIEEAAKNRGIKFLGFRQVPVDPTGIVATVIRVELDIVQSLVDRPSEIESSVDFE